MAISTLGCQSNDSKMNPLSNDTAAVVIVGKKKTAM